MHLEYTSNVAPYRTGTIKGLSLAKIRTTLSEIAPDTRLSHDKKTTIAWRFLANGELCGIWDYKRDYEVLGELSTFGPDAIFTELFGKSYSPC
jgi:hypothetical protein